MSNIVKKSEPTTTALEWDPFRSMREFMRWDPFREMAALSGRFEKPEFLPAFEVRETGDAYLFKADLPGVKDSDIDISLSGNRLSVSGKRESDREEKSDTIYTYERSYGSFTRSFTLPEGIDADHIRTELKDGVLTLAIPKRPGTQARQIAVKAAESKSKA
jgi:HSP20 family protein